LHLNVSCMVERKENKANETKKINKGYYRSFNE